MESPPRTKRAAPSLPAAPIKKAKKANKELKIRDAVNRCSDDILLAFDNNWDFQKVYETFEEFYTTHEMKDFVKSLDKFLKLAIKIATSTNKKEKRINLSIARNAFGTLDDVYPDLNNAITKAIYDTLKDANLDTPTKEELVYLRKYLMEFFQPDAKQLIAKIVESVFINDELID